MARLNALSPTVASRQCVPILADEIYGDMVSVSCSPLHSQCYLSFLMHVILGHGSQVSRGEVRDSSTPLCLGPCLELLLLWCTVLGEPLLSSSLPLPKRLAFM